MADPFSSIAMVVSIWADKDKRDALAIFTSFLFPFFKLT